MDICKTRLLRAECSGGQGLRSLLLTPGGRSRAPGKGGFSRYLGQRTSSLMRPSAYPELAVVTWASQGSSVSYGYRRARVEPICCRGG